MYIVMVWDVGADEPYGEFTAHTVGPFSRKSEAQKYAEEYLGGLDWIVKILEKP